MTRKKLISLIAVIFVAVISLSGGAFLLYKMQSPDQPASEAHYSGKYYRYSTITYNGNGGVTSSGAGSISHSSHFIDGDRSNGAGEFYSDSDQGNGLRHEHKLDGWHEWTVHNETTSNNYFTRPGYYIESWNTNSAGTGTRYAFDSTIRFSDGSGWAGHTNDRRIYCDGTLYAQWVPIRYKVSLDLNGGKFDNNPDGYWAQSDSYYVKNYRVEGVNGTTIYTSNPPSEDAIRRNESVSLPDGGGGGIGGKISKLGHTFLGWTQGDSTEVIRGSPETGNSIYFGNFSGDITLNAEWEPMKFRVSYSFPDVDSGGPTENGEATFGVEYNIPAEYLPGGASAPVRAGETFGGWQKLGTTEIITKFTLKTALDLADVVLVAKWSQVQYTMTFHGTDVATLDGGGEENVVEYTGLLRGTTIMAPNVTVAAGYTFVGWALGSATGTKHTTPPFIFPVSTTESNDYYAVTEGRQIDVTWRSYDGVEVIKQTQTVAYGENAIFPDPTDKANSQSPGNLLKNRTAGYTFAGWVTQPSGSPVVSSLTAITPDSTTLEYAITTDESSITYYATYSANTYAITFALGGGTKNSEYGTDENGDQTGKSWDNAGSNATIAFAPTKTGATFLGWGVTGHSALLQPKSSYSIAYIWNTFGYDDTTQNANVAKDESSRTYTLTLTAQWQGSTYAIALNPNTTDTGTKTLIGTPSWPKIDGTNTEIGMLFLEYGMGWKTEQSKTYDAAFTKITPPTLPGYIFQGYYKDASGGTQIVNADGTFIKTGSWNTTYTGDGTAYAQWKMKSNYTIVFDLGDATGKSITPSVSNKVGVSWDTNLFSVLGNLTLAGMTFDGWHKRKDNVSGLLYDKVEMSTSQHNASTFRVADLFPFGDIVDSPADESKVQSFTLYARWIVNAPVLDQVGSAPIAASGLSYTGKPQQLITKAYTVPANASGEYQYDSTIIQPEYYVTMDSTDYGAGQPVGVWVTNITQIFGTNVGTHYVRYRLRNNVVDANKPGAVSVAVGTVPVVISQLNLADVEIEFAGLDYKGTPWEPGFRDFTITSFSIKGEEMGEGAGLRNAFMGDPYITLSGYSNNINAGTKTASFYITAIGSENFRGSKQFFFTINKISLQTAVTRGIISFTLRPVIATGSQILPTWYDLEILGHNIGLAGLDDSDFSYTLNSETKYQYKTLEYGTNTNVADNNTNNYVLITATADSLNFTADTTYKVFFTIQKKNLETSDFDINLDEVMYDGSTHAASITAKDTSDYGPGEVTIYYERYIFDENTGETNQKDNTGLKSTVPRLAGRYVLYVINNAGESSNFNSATEYIHIGEFFIRRVTLSNGAEGVGVSLSVDSVTYNGSNQTPTVTVTYSGLTASNKALKQGVDYRLGFDNLGSSSDTFEDPELTNAGEIRVYVIGLGNFTGTNSQKIFTINKFNLASAKIDIDGEPKFHYDEIKKVYYTEFDGGSDRRPQAAFNEFVKLSVKLPGSSVYSVIYTSGDIGFEMSYSSENGNFTEVGEITIKIIPSPGASAGDIGLNYTGTATLTYEVRQATVIIKAMYNGDTLVTKIYGQSPRSFGYYATGDNYRNDSFEGDVVEYRIFTKSNPDIKEGSDDEIFDTPESPLPAGTYWIYVDVGDPETGGLKNNNYIIISADGSDNSRMGMTQYIVDKYDLTPADIGLTFPEGSSYTGRPIKPTPTMTFGGRTVNIANEFEPYENSYLNNINAGEASITLIPTSGSNFRGAVTIYFTITPFNLQSTYNPQNPNAPYLYMTFVTDDGIITYNPNDPNIGEFYAKYTGMTIQPQIIAYIRIGNYDSPTYSHALYPGSENLGDAVTFSYGGEGRSNIDVNDQITNEASVTMHANGSNLTGYQTLEFDIRPADPSTVELQFSFFDGKNSATFATDDVGDDIAFNENAHTLTSVINLVTNEAIAAIIKIKYKKIYPANEAWTEYREFSDPSIPKINGNLPAGIYDMIATVEGGMSANYQKPLNNETIHLTLTIESKIYVVVNVMTTNTDKFVVDLSFVTQNGNDKVYNVKTEQLYGEVAGSMAEGQNLFAITGIRGETGTLRAKLTHSNSNTTYSVNWLNFSNTPVNSDDPFDAIRGGTLTPTGDLGRSPIINLYVAQIHTIRFFDNTDAEIRAFRQSVRHGGVVDNAPELTLPDAQFVHWTTDQERLNIVVDRDGDKNGLDDYPITVSTNFYPYFAELDIDDTEGNYTAPVIKSPLIYTGEPLTVLVGNADYTSHENEYYYYYLSKTQSTVTNAQMLTYNLTATATNKNIFNDNRLKATDAGTYYLYYMGRTAGNTESSMVRYMTVTVSPAELSNANSNITIGLFTNVGHTLPVTNESYIFNGRSQKPYMTLTYSGIKTANGVLIENIDFTVLYVNSWATLTQTGNTTDAGEITMTITGKGNYSGTMTVTYKINPVNLSSPNVIVNLYKDIGKSALFPATVEFDGTNQQPLSYEVIFATDYAIHTPASTETEMTFYRGEEQTSDTTKIGVITVRITATGSSRNYAGYNTSQTYTVGGQDASQWYKYIPVDDFIRMDDPNRIPTYNGSLIDPKTFNFNLVVTDKNGERLTRDVDYVVEGEPRTNAGEYTMQLRMINPDYYGTCEIKWVIKKRALQQSDFTVSGDINTPYNAKPHAPVVFTPKNNMVLGTQKVEYQGSSGGLTTTLPTDASGYRVYLTVEEGINNEAGFRSVLMATFNITPIVLDDVRFTAINDLNGENAWDEIPSAVYNGQPQIPQFAIWTNEIKLNPTDYEVRYENDGYVNVDGVFFDMNVTHAGTITVSVSAVGTNVTGACSIQYIINPKNISASDIEIDEIPPQPYTGSAITPTPTIFDTTVSPNVPLQMGVDYTVAWSNNTGSGNKAIIEVTGIGNYDDVINLQFTIASRILINFNSYVNNGDTPPDLEIWFGGSGSTYNSATYKTQIMSGQYQTQYIIDGLLSDVTGHLYARHLNGPSVGHYVLSWASPVWTEYTPSLAVVTGPSLDMSINQTVTLTFGQIYEVTWENTYKKYDNDGTIITTETSQTSLVVYGHEGYAHASFDPELAGYGMPYRAENYTFMGWSEGGENPSDVSIMGYLKTNVDHDTHFFACFYASDATFTSHMVGATDLEFNNKLQPLLVTLAGAEDARAIYYLKRPASNRLVLNAEELGSAKTGVTSPDQLTGNRKLLFEEGITANIISALSETNAGTYYIYCMVETGSGPYVYSTIRSVVVTIAAVNIADASVAAKTASNTDFGNSVTYDGTDKIPASYTITATLDGVLYTLVKDTDFTVYSYKNEWQNIQTIYNPNMGGSSRDAIRNSGLVTVNIQGKGNFGGMNTSFIYNISPINIATGTLNFTVNGQPRNTAREYNSKTSYLPDVNSITLGGISGFNINDYDLSYERQISGSWVTFYPYNVNLIDAGTVRVVLTSKASNRNYAGSVFNTFTITPQNINDWLITDIPLSYNATNQTYHPIITDKQGTSLTEGVHYELSGNVQKNAGTHTLAITLKDTATNFTGGTRNLTWVMNGALITVKVADITKTYGAADPNEMTYDIYGLIEGDVLNIVGDFNIVAISGTPAIGVDRPVGQYSLVATGLLLDTDNYVINSLVSGILYVDPADFSAHYAGFTTVPQNVVYNGNPHAPEFEFYVNDKKLINEYTLTYTNMTNAGNFLTTADVGVLTEAGLVTVILTANSENRNVTGQATITFTIERATNGTLAIAFDGGRSSYDATSTDGGVTFNPTKIITTTTPDIQNVLSYRYKVEGAPDSTATTSYPTSAGKYTVLVYITAIPANYSVVNGVEINSTPIKVATLSETLIITSRVFLQLTVNATEPVDVTVWFGEDGTQFTETFSGTDNYVTSLIIRGLIGDNGKINARVTATDGRIFNLSWTPNTTTNPVHTIATEELSSSTDITQTLYLSEIYTINWYSYDGNEEIHFDTTNVLHNQLATVSMPTRTDWIFDGWTDNADADTRYDGYWTRGDKVLTGLTATNVTENKNYYALFIEQSVDIVSGVTVNPAISSYTGADWQLLSVGGRVAGETSNRNVTMFYMVKSVTEDAPSVVEIVANNVTSITNVTKRDAGTYIIYYVARSEGGSEFSPVGVIAVTIRRADISINVNINMLLADGTTKFTGGTYNGHDIAPDIVNVIFGGHITTLGNGILTEEQDYTKTYRNTYQGGSIYSYNYTGTDLLQLAGTIRITVEGIGNYIGIAYVEYEITPANLANATEITLTGVDNFIYDGSPHVPASVSVKIGDLSVPNSDYEIGAYYRGDTITYNYADAGTLGVVLSAHLGSRNFTGSTILNFAGSTYTIAKRTLTEDSLSTYISYDAEYNAIYTGGQLSIIHPSLKLAYSGMGTIVVYYEGITYNGLTYSKTTTAPTETGNYTITISAEESTNFFAVPEFVIATYTISPRNIGDEFGNEVYIIIDYTAANYTYTGFAIIPAYMVTHPMTTADLIAGDDFTFNYHSNINAGNNTGIINLTGVGNYTGTARGYFTITPANISDVDISYTSPDTVQYNGAIQRPTFLATLGELPEIYTLASTDYSVTYLNRTVMGEILANNDPNVLIKAGTITINISPRSTNFTGQALQFTYTIQPYDLGVHADEINVVFSNADPMFNAYQYTGNEINPIFTISSSGITGGNLSSYNDFIPTLYNNVNAGSYAVYGPDAPHVLITGTGNFTGEYIAYFKIVSKIIITINNTNVTGVKPQINVWLDTTGKQTYQTAKYKATGNNGLLTLEGIEGEPGILKTEYVTNGTYCLTDGTFTDIVTGTGTDVTIRYYDVDNVEIFDARQSRTAQIKIAQLYKIEYSSSVIYGGTLPVYQYKIHGTNYTAMPNQLTRDGYTGNGWNISNTTKQTPDFADGSAITLNTNTTLYANWRAIMYEIRLMALTNPVAGTFEYTEMTESRLLDIVYDTQLNVLINAFPDNDTHPITVYHKGFDYTFMGWSLTPQNAFTAIVLPPLPEKLTGNMILYAVYSKTTSTRTFNITFKSKFYMDGDIIRNDINGQIVGSSEAVYNSPIYTMENFFTPEVFTHNGWIYRFKGWTTDPEAGYGDTVLTGDILANLYDDTTFYAVFDRIKASPYI